MKNIVVVGIPHPSEKNLFLHGQRRDNNLWSSVAGHAHEGEELAEAAKREMNEETGIQSSDIKQVNQQDFDTMHGPIKVTLFICPTASGELTPKNDPDKEFSKYAWLDPTSERDDWHVPQHRNLLAQYAKSIQKFEQLIYSKLEKTNRDINDAAEFAAYHVSPFMAENDSPESHAKSREKVKREILTAPRKTINLDVNKAHAALNPVDNGRRPSSKHMKNPIVLGKIGNKHVILDGHHRLIAAKEKGLKSIKAHVLDLPKHHDILLDVEGGHGKLGKSELSKAKITAYHGTPYDFKSFRMPKNPKNLNYGPGLYFSGKPETASDFSTLQVYHPSFDEAYNKYKKSKEYKRHQKVKDPEQRKHLERNAITNIAGLSPKVMRAELNVKNPYNPYDIEHAKKVSQAAGYPDDFKDFEGHNKEDPHETNFYDMMAAHSLGWNPEKGHSDFYGPKSTYSDRSKKLNSAVRAAGFDAIHDPKEDYHVIFNTKQVKNKSFGKSELDKGAMGDWKKEGYKLHLAPNSMNPENFHIIPKDKNGKEVGFYGFENHVSSPHHIVVYDAYTDRNHQRKGLATQAYKMAEKHSKKKIVPLEGQQSEDAQELWAQPRRPFGKSEISHYFNKFLAANPDEDVKIHPNDVMLNAVHRRW